MLVPYEIAEQIRIGCFFTFFERHFAYGHHFPGETHDFWECVYVLEGSIYASGDERIYHLTRDEIIFHKPLELHKFHVDCPEGATLLIFSFSLTGPLSGAFTNKVFKLSHSQKSIMTAMLEYIRNAASGPSASTGTSFTYLRAARLPVYLQMLSAYVSQLFLSLLDSGSVSRVYTAPDALTFRKAVHYMNEHLDRKASVTEIARYCNVSESGLKRIFYTYSGMGIHKYFLKLKMKTATELLENGASVTSITEKLGYSSQAYFSAAFKRETGKCPSSLKAASLTGQPANK